MTATDTQTALFSVVKDVEAKAEKKQPTQGMYEKREEPVACIVCGKEEFWVTLENICLACLISERARKRELGHTCEGCGEPITREIGRYGCQCGFDYGMPDYEYCEKREAAHETA